MKTTHLKSLIIVCLYLFLFSPVVAQDVTIPFDITAEGKRFYPTWGLDQAWISEQNMRKGINHMGKENIGIGRSCFRTNKALVNDSALNSAEISKLRERNKWLSLVNDTLPIVLTADQEGGTDAYYVVNKSCDVNHWAANINSHVHWLQQNSKHPVLGVSIFNEPDYWSVEEGATTAKQTQIARLLRQDYTRLDNVIIAGGNTLNDDKALEWYNASKQYIDWGNTHQLAGSFDNFAMFYQQVAADGKVGYADEMHNVGEAMIALEYGATVGIWWGFDSRARGEFCDISRHGERLAYGEHRTNWTAASVYRHDDGRVKAFIGSSERQAATTDYRFVSVDRDVFFDGYGPQRIFNMQIPGGKVGSYQKDQTNAERVIDITWGEDVQSAPIETGTYKLVNLGNGNVAAVSGSNIVTNKYTKAKTQQWNVSLINPRIGGDYSFYDFRVASNGKTCMDVENYSCLTNANVIAYTPSANPTSNQQWYLQYAGNGCYYIRNRESALYLSASSNKTTNGINVLQRTLQTDSILHACQLWKLLPVDVAYDVIAPSTPVGLALEPDCASVLLTWERGTETDLDGYMVLRADEVNGIEPQWNTIARKVYPPYKDNQVVPGHTYLYKIKAIDQSQNISHSSETVSIAAPTRMMLGHWTWEGSVSDFSGNSRDAITAVTPVYGALHRQGEQSLRFGNSQYVTLPTLPAFSDEGFSLALWVNCSSSSNQVRIFDFGYDDDHYVYLTPRNSANRHIRLALKNGADEQILDASSTLSVSQWKHVVVTMSHDCAAIYIDGEPVAQGNGFTITPSDLRPVLCYLGRSQSGTAPLFQGYMDDICLFSYALTADEVKAIFNGETEGIRHPLSEVLPVTPIHTLGGVRIPTPRSGLNVMGGRVVQYPRQ